MCETKSRYETKEEPEPLLLTEVIDTLDDLASFVKIPLLRDALLSAAVVAAGLIIDKAHAVMEAGE